MVEFYNKETGTFLGRTGKSWAKISAFYVVYFAFLAGLFTASIHVMKTQTVDPEIPTLQTRLQVPGLNVFPKINPDNSTQVGRWAENEGLPFFWDSSNQASWEFYADIVAQEHDSYNKKAKNVENNEKPGKNQNVENFDWDTFRLIKDQQKGISKCADYPYDWNTNEPCIFLRLNRVINWQPIGLFQPEGIFANEGNLPQRNMVKDAVYVRCESKFLGDENEEAEPLTFTYFGGEQDNGDGYIESKFFPFMGKPRQPDYQSPIVAMKVKNLKDGQKHRVTCHSFAKNIVIDERDNLGSIKFEIQHAGTAEKTTE